MDRSIRSSAFVIAALIVSFASAHSQQTVGLFLDDEASYSGYTLFSPLSSFVTYLIDRNGKPVRAWVSGYRPGQSVYLLENGSILRTGQYVPAGVTRFNAGGAGGRVEAFAWEGARTWDYAYSDNQHRQHHDIEYLPNGNVLLVAWELKTQAEALAAGRKPSLLSDGELWPDHVVEVQPTGPTSGVVVWEWHVWDHLIQDYDALKDNYGVVADHPELIDVNYVGLGGPGGGKADWNHVNAVDYHEGFDQIVLSVHSFSELWVIDHSTTTAEAAGHRGGNSGMGGDLLYRWGNPQAYDRGGLSDQRLFHQHDAQWIETGCPGEGDFLVFNNGQGRPSGDYSSVDEIVPPVDEFGHYDLASGSAYGPAEASWSYTATPPSTFFAQNVSGAQRLPNDNTLICDGPHGDFFEVTSAHEKVWRYVNPIGNSGPIHQGTPPNNNVVFRAYRYGPDYPAFEGKDLTPGAPLELFDSPLPVPDGDGATDPLTASRTSATGSRIQVDWDADSCQAHDYDLIYGFLGDVSGHVVEGAECGIGVLGTYDWLRVPDGDVFFLIVGVDPLGIYESSWGEDSTGAERNGASSSWTCGVTTKDVSESCP